MWFNFSENRSGKVFRVEADWNGLVLRFLGLPQEDTPANFPDLYNKDNAKKCPRCPKSLIARWLGIRWYGKPAPLRLWAAIVRGDDPGMWPGCGCIVKLKSSWQALKVFLRTVRTA
jgi:hypothetical protein